MIKKLIAGASAVVFSLGSAPLFRGYLAASANSPRYLSFGITAGTVAVSGDVTDGTETVTVDIDLEGNEGVQSWVLLLSYDTSKVSFESVSSDYFNGIKTYDKGGEIVINDFENKDVTANGTAASLTFKVKKGLAKGSTDCFSLNVSDDPEDFFNYADLTLATRIIESKAQLTLADRVPVTGVDFSVGALTIDPGSTVRPTYTIFPETANNRNVTFRSSDENIAAVDAKGRITARSEGECEITVTTADGGFSDTMIVSVQTSPGKLLLIPKTMTAGSSGEIDLTSYDMTQAVISGLTVSSTDAAVAEASLSGSKLTINAFRQGVAAIKCTATDGSTAAVVNLTVKEDKGFTVRFSEENITLSRGESKTLSLVTEPADSPQAASFGRIEAWNISSSDDSVVAVQYTEDVYGVKHPTGQITALKEGTAEIIALHPDYIDGYGKQIPIVCTVKTTGGTGITANIKAKNAPADTSFNVKLYSDGKLAAEKNVSEYGAEIFDGIPDGKYTALITCGSTGYAQKQTTVTVESGRAVIEEELLLYGDVTADGKLELDDVALLQQYCSEWKVTLPYPEVGNIDGSEDGEITLSDIALLQQYLTGWNVTIGRKTTTTVIELPVIPL